MLSSERLTQISEIYLLTHQKGILTNGQNILFLKVNSVTPNSIVKDYHHHISLEMRKIRKTIVLLLILQVQYIDHTLTILNTKNLLIFLKTNSKSIQELGHVRQNNHSDTIVRHTRHSRVTSPNF